MIAKHDLQKATSEIKAASLDPSTSGIVVGESVWAVVGRLSARCAAYASRLPIFKVDIFLPDQKCLVVSVPAARLEPSPMQ
jgi:hypothetical protein